MAYEQPPGQGHWAPNNSATPENRGESRSGLRRAARVVGALTVAVVMAAAAIDLSQDSTPPYRGGISDSQPATPDPTAPSHSRDPSASLLTDLIVSDSDVAPTLAVAGLRGGNGLRVPTLDLCNGTFPSEEKRTARLQVAAVDGGGVTALSTEAVLYGSGAGPAGAFRELGETAAACPDRPVDSPVGLPSVTTRFGPAPDADWPQVTSVERIAFALETTDENGETSRSVAVYLRRGRALLGVYFSHTDAPSAVVAGKTELGDIVTIFANRLAKVPVAAISTTA